MYTDINFKTKKALREAINGGAVVTVFQPGPFGKDPSTYNGRVAIEGPHYPAAHNWYATAIVKDGVVVKVS